MDAEAGLELVPINPNRTEDLQVRRTLERHANVASTPKHAQVIRYEREQHYTTHQDFVDREDHLKRVATFVLYLSDVEAGGETFFSSLEVDDSTGELVPYDTARKVPSAHCATMPKFGPPSVCFRNARFMTVTRMKRTSMCTICGVAARSLRKLSPGPSYLVSRSLLHFKKVHAVSQERVRASLFPRPVQRDQEPTCRSCKLRSLEWH